MFHRRVRDQIEQSISHGGASTARLLTRHDGLGFSLSIVTAPKGGPHLLNYRHHREASFIISGRARIDDLDNRRSWEIGPGDMYVVGPGHRHQATDLTDVTVMGVFVPPLEGIETHDDEGGYPPSGPQPDGPAEMYVRTPADLRAMGRERRTGDGKARLLRYLLAEDGMGFTWSDVHPAEGTEARLWYKNHWEANYVIAGTGTVTHRETGECLPLEPGWMYCVGPDDPHVLKAGPGLHLVSLFNPPLDGTETHDKDGAYPPTGPLPPGPPRGE